jgi:hypothetical protein
MTESDQMVLSVVGNCIKGKIAAAMTCMFFMDSSQLVSQNAQWSLHQDRIYSKWTWNFWANYVVIWHNHQVRNLAQWTENGVIGCV